ncbi:hypothetical protein [Flavobacterium cerinum]|uniref:Uncharacterized protein n=1 Tax=Flavobacterium cerinum TaxID=2502784 RepID=A0ABY5IRH2_9FLAO|nr:hypothetical protein [Flavobacterium cerinum]UUC44885.1 hypothetical protein NOX80_14795 [Flavobacterium cerinum]
MRVLSFFVLILFTVFYACKNDSAIKMPKFKLPEVFDTLKGELENRKAFSLQTANYKCLYLGKNQDSVYVRIPKEDEAYTTDFRGNDIESGPEDITIFIDTTKVISNHTLLEGKIGEELVQKKYKAFPVVVVNKGKDTLNIGSGNYLRLLLEAKNPSGYWIPIEDKYMYFCGTFLRSIRLPPGRIAVTSVPIDNGKFKTKLRLRLNKDIISHEFSGVINKEQFEIK